MNNCLGNIFTPIVLLLFTFYALENEIIKFIESNKKKLKLEEEMLMMNRKSMVQKKNKKLFALK